MPLPAALLEQFCTYLLAERRLANTSVAAYRSDLEFFCAWAADKKLLVECITREDLLQFLKYIKAQGAVGRTIARKTSSLRLFFAFLADRMGLHNPALHLTVPPNGFRLPSYLSEAEVQKLLATADGQTTAKGRRNRAMLYCLYATGMRVSELVNLTIDQLDLEQGFIRVRGKGDKERMVPLPNEVTNLLHQYMTHTLPTLYKKMARKAQPLFPAAGKNKPLTRHTFWRLLRQLLLESGITKRVSPHSLRHSLATHLLARGADIRSLQMLLGHAHIDTVQRYTQVEKTHLRAVYDKKHPRS